MNAVSPFIEEAAKIAASQKMSPVPKVRRGKTPLGIQKLIDSSQKPSEKLADARLLLPAAVHGVIGAGRVAHAAGKGSRVAGAVGGGLAGAIGGGLGAAVGGGLGWLAGGQVGHSDAGTLLGGLAGATYGGDLVVGDVVKEVKKNREKTAVPAALIEGLTGAGVGAGLGALSAARKPKEERGKAMRRRALIGGAGGGLAGWGVGAGLRRHMGGKDFDHLMDAREGFLKADSLTIDAEIHADKMRDRLRGLSPTSSMADVQKTRDVAEHARGLANRARGTLAYHEPESFIPRRSAFGLPSKDSKRFQGKLDDTRQAVKRVKRLLKEAGIGVNSWARLAHENKAPGAKTRTPLRRLGRAIVTSPRAQGAAVGLAAGAYGVHKVKQMLDQHQENRQRQQQMQQHQAAMAHYQKQAAATAYEKILKATESTRPYALSAGAGGATGLGAHEFLRGEEPATLKGRLLWGGIGAGAGLIDRKLREDAKKRGLAKEAFASAVDGRANGMAGVKRPQFPTKGSQAMQMRQLNSLQTPNPKPTPTNNQQAAVPRPSNVIPG